MMGLKTAALRYLKLALKAPRLQPTCGHEQVPVVFREPHIFTGFRPPYRSWGYYVMSMFQLHNESLNIWTHLLAVVIFAVKLYFISEVIDFTDRATWGVLGFGVTVLGYASLSTMAHMFHSKSELIHYTSFQADYIGIGIYAHGTAGILYFCTAPPEFYDTLIGRIFVPVNVALSILACVGCCYAKMRYKRPYPFQRRLWQLGTCGIQIIFAAIPLVYAILQCSANPSCPSNQMAPHYSYCAWFALSIFFFTSHLPEKIFPGYFDLIGNGHQLFHVFITYTTLLQFDAAVHDLLSKPRSSALLAAPSVLSVFGSTFLVVLGGVIAIICMRSKVKATIIRDAKNS